MITIIAFLLILSVLVLIHEFGHFLTAKKFGIKVEEFGVGFPPRAWGKKVGETIYSINWLPIGGFVKMYGEDEAGMGKINVKNPTQVEGDLNRAFFARPLWQRMLVVVAGVIMNFMLGVVLLSVLTTVVGTAIPANNIIVTEVSPKSPAALHGIQKDDKILSLNNKKLKDLQGFISETNKNKGKEVTLTILRNNREINITLVPRTVIPKGEGAMGVAITDTIVKKCAWYMAPVCGTKEALNFTYLTFKGLAMVGPLMLDSVLHFRAPAGVAGPIGIAQITGQAVKLGWEAVANIMVLLTLNLAVLNILPIPALDGGRFLFLVIEFLRGGKRIDPKKEAVINAVGFILLLTFVFYISFFDVTRWIQGRSILP